MRRPAAASPRRARERLPREGPTAEAEAHARPSASAAAFARSSGPASSPRLWRRMTSTHKVRISRSNDPRAPRHPPLRVSESDLRVKCDGHAKKHSEDYDAGFRGCVETRPPARTRATRRAPHRATIPSPCFHFRSASDPSVPPPRPRSVRSRGDLRSDSAPQGG